MENPTKLTPQEIQYILTLRYNPQVRLCLSQLSWSDFQENKSPSLDTIEELIIEAISDKMGKSKDTAIALSGGVDSTLSLAMLRKNFPDVSVNAVSIKFSNSIDETVTASKIAEHFEIDHKTVYVENYLSELPQALSIIKMPFWDLHWYHVIKQVAIKSKHLVSGDGGDELFGGYTFRYQKFLSLVDNSTTPQDKVLAYLQCHQRDMVYDQQDIFDEKMNFSWDNIYSLLLPCFDNSLSLIDQVFLADYNGKLLHNFEPLNSKINSHFGVSSVTPLLSQKLINYAIKIDHNYKYDKENNLGKLPLRKLLERYNVEHLVNQKKQGFSVDITNMWKMYARDICKQYLQESRIVKDKWIKKDWIDKYINQDDLEIPYINKFLGLLAFEIWYRLFITRELKSTEKLS